MKEPDSDLTDGVVTASQIPVDSTVKWKTRWCADHLIRVGENDSARKMYKKTWQILFQAERWL